MGDDKRNLSRGLSVSRQWQINTENGKVVETESREEGVVYWVENEGENGTRPGAVKRE